MKRGRILRIKVGYNPNSSSLGTDLSCLLIGSTALLFLVNVADAGLRIWYRRRNRRRAAAR